MRNGSSRARRQLVIAGITVLAMGVVIALLEGDGPASDRTHRLAVAILTASGPLAGWWIAMSGYGIARMWGFLFWTSAIPLVPLLLWRRRLNPAFLGLSTVLWFLVGFYCSVGMWI